MTKKVILILMLLQTIVCSSIVAQSKQGNQWMTGRGTTVIFDNNLVTTKYIAVTPWHYFMHGNSNICDTNGNMILCSDGFNIYDSIGNYIDGGDNSSCQLLNHIQV